MVNDRTIVVIAALLVICELFAFHDPLANTIVAVEIALTAYLTIKYKTRIL